MQGRRERERERERAKKKKHASRIKKCERNVNWGKMHKEKMNKKKNAQE